MLQPSILDLVVAGDGETRRSEASNFACLWITGQVVSNMRSIRYQEAACGIPSFGQLTRGGLWWISSPD